MKKVIISTDSVADLGQLYEERNIKMLGIGVNLGEKECIDGESITSQEILDYYNATNKLPKTSAISPEAYREYFQKMIGDTDSEVVHFTLSSSMSSCYNNAVEGAKGLNVHVVDSKNLSTGLGLQVLYADDLACQGLGAEEITRKVIERQGAVQASFVIDTMTFLYKGGRCGGVSAFVASVLKIHPSIMVKDGAMGVGKKYLGPTERCLMKYVDDILETYDKPDLKYVFVTHSPSNQALVDKVKAKVLEKYPDANVYETEAGATVTSHCGGNTIGVLYYNDGE